MPKKRSKKQFVIPMKLTYQSDCIVEAFDEQDAIHRANDGDFEEGDLSEITDWSVEGEPELSE